MKAINIQYRNTHPTRSECLPNQQSSRIVASTTRFDDTVARLQDGRALSEREITSAKRVGRRLLQLGGAPFRAIIRWHKQLPVRLQLVCVTRMSWQASKQPFNTELYESLRRSFSSAVTCARQLDDALAWKETVCVAKKLKTRHWSMGNYDFVEEVLEAKNLLEALCAYK